jgi:hypothetical protein
MRAVFLLLPHSGTYCMFSTIDSSGTYSWLYNVSAVTGVVLSRTRLAGIAYNLHVDFATGGCFTVMMDTTARTAVVVFVVEDTVSTIVDITSYLGSEGRIHPGASTQCSTWAAGCCPPIQQASTTNKSAVTLAIADRFRCVRVLRDCVPCAHQVTRTTCGSALTRVAPTRTRC